MTPLKKCTKCGEEKPATTNFYNRSGDKLRSYCKACQSGIWGKHYAENKEKHLKRAREYKKENSERCKQLRRRYYESHKEEEAENLKRWLKSNPERVKIYQERSRKRISEWAKTNRARRAKTNGELRKRNPEKYKQQRSALYYKHHEKYKERARIHSNKATNELRDSYVKMQIAKSTGMSRESIPEPFIELKRIHIKLKRKIKNTVTP